ncbi:RNA-directed DNA methylation 4 [Sesamum angolense]|uniref:RNA-directed DNA methylation 4 n=1 Tax=Sesamum angolense TaxID=2727404 RepID=A0AAE1X9I7_9LAMI|nr:RNA-directed DNA methylation 4 [Sesamum angolense]
MAEGSSSASSIGKPVIVRVKRKAFQSAIDAFWLEIHERPLKRPLLDFGKLSISDTCSSRVEELKTKKILVRHVETVTSSEDTFDVLRSFVPNPSDELKSTEKNEEGRRNIKTGKNIPMLVLFPITQDGLNVARSWEQADLLCNLLYATAMRFCLEYEADGSAKQDQLLVKAKQSQEVLSRNARFEQIWRSRKGKKETPEDEAIYEMCRLYDVVRVDVEEREFKVQKEKDMDVDDCRMMADYLPLLKEVLPTAALEIEHDIHDYMSKQASADDYVYDFYAFKEEANVMEGDSARLFPLVQVDDDDDYYNGPDDSEYGTDDSNAENNPLNDYPDEEISEDEDEVTSTASDEKSQAQSQTSGSQSEEVGSGSEVSYEHSGHPYRSNNADQFLEDDWCSDVDGNADQFFEDGSYFDGDDESFW